jgi:hypothetical protein
LWFSGIFLGFCAALKFVVLPLYSILKRKPFKVIFPMFFEEKMTNKNKSGTLFLGIALVLATFLVSLVASINMASAAVLVDNVDQGIMYPGTDTSVDITLKNTYDYTVQDVSFSLVFSGIDPTSGKQVALSFSPVGSSSDTIDEIEDDDTERFSFDVRSSNSIEPGDYVLPYVVSYKNKNDTIQTETGTISIHVNSKTSLDFSVSQTTKVIGMKDKATFKIINKGFGEIKFVTVQLNEAESTGFTLLSDDKVYIGSIASDDSETASFDVLLNKANPSLSVTITYKDFENNDKTQNVDFGLTAYSRERALQLGLIKKSNAPYIFGVIIVLLIVFFIVRAVRRARKRKLNNLNKSL